jgi:predicted aconitase with swiveling domain
LVELKSVIRGQPVIAGEARGEVVHTDEPLSFWGGYNAREGRIIDKHHELNGMLVGGKIFVLPGTRGSSTGSGILLEAIRLGNAPAAMVLKRRDAILALGAIVARELYDKIMPLVIVSDQDFEKLRDVRSVEVREDGTITSHSFSRSFTEMELKDEGE